MEEAGTLRLVNTIFPTSTGVTCCVCVQAFSQFTKTSIITTIDRTKDLIIRKFNISQSYGDVRAKHRMKLTSGLPARQAPSVLRGAHPHDLTETTDEMALVRETCNMGDPAERVVTITHQ